jgi:monofunctional glycosyltransferase
MSPSYNDKAAFRRRPDRSLGWAALESRQSAAICAALSRPAAEPLFDPPGELLPFPAATRRRRGLGEIARLVFAWIVALQLCYLAATAILINVYRGVDPPATVLMAYRKWGFGWKLTAPRPVSLAKVPRYVRSMLVSIEDGKFYEHHGLDFEAFKNAREINKRVGKPLYGGSTLTMQVARTLFLVPEKSYLRKYLEVLTALELEAFLPKTRILELYFGYAEWGKGIFGMDSAARKWYGVGLSNLSRDQAAHLVALLSSPIKYGPETLRKSGILRERYAYLSRRYVARAAESSGPQATAVGAAAGTPSASAEASPTVAAETPPPSPEPGEEIEADSPAESGGAAGAAAPAAVPAQ